jgi:hypothetical protein
MATPLTAQQEAEAQALADRLRKEADDPILAIARLLVATDEHTLFGATEFAIRKQALALIAKAYGVYLAEKKTATLAPPSSARTATRPQRTTATGNGKRKASAE